MNETIRIFQINASGGGVPKKPLRSAEVNFLGLTTDRHNDVVHHGGPEKALCLYSLELIKLLQVEGHPIFPGSTGENLTLTGLDWSLVKAGLRLRLGQSVAIEVTRYASPCQTIQDSFKGQTFDRISWRTHPGWARAYAKVLTPGFITIGDSVTLLD
jgi:MOSC domain-containing protein YiiM